MRYPPYGPSFQRGELPSRARGIRWKRVAKALVRVAALVATITLPGAAHAQDWCSSCHLGGPTRAFEPQLEQYLSTFAQRHVDDWVLSPHGLSEVGCARCHGGDPNAFDPVTAHQPILSSRNPASPVRRANIPETCGSCHPGPYASFQESQHFQLLNDGNRRVPVCVTCHDEVGARLLSPAGLESTCNRCHGDDAVAPRPGRAADARLLLEGAGEVRDSLAAARRLIERLGEGARRSRLEESYLQAQRPITQAVEEGHRFVYDGLQERLSAARALAADLLDEIVDPGP